MAKRNSQESKDGAQKTSKEQEKPEQRPRAKLTSADIARLRGATLCSEPTIRAWARGDRTTASNERIIRIAAEKLGIQIAS